MIDFYSHRLFSIWSDCSGCKYLNPFESGSVAHLVSSSIWEVSIVIWTAGIFKDVAQISGNPISNRQAHREMRNRHPVKKLHLNSGTTQPKMHLLIFETFQICKNRYFCQLQNDPLLLSLIIVTPLFMETNISWIPDGESLSLFYDYA